MNMQPCSASEPPRLEFAVEFEAGAFALRLITAAPADEARFSRWLQRPKTRERIADDVALMLQRVAGWDFEEAA